MESSDPLDLTFLLAAILQRAEKRVGTEHGYLCLLNPTIDKLEIVYGTGLATPYNDAFVERGEGLAGKVLESGEVLVIDDYGRWSGRVSDERTQNRQMAVAALGVPIRLRGETVGVIGLFYAEPEREFSQPQIEFLIKMGETAGTILDNATRTPREQLSKHVDAFEKAFPDP